MGEDDDYHDGGQRAKNESGHERGLPGTSGIFRLLDSLLCNPPVLTVSQSVTANGPDVM